MKKPSLLDRLTNAVSADDPYEDLFDDEHEPMTHQAPPMTPPAMHSSAPINPPQPKAAAPKPAAKTSAPHQIHSGMDWDDEDEMDEDEIGDLPVDLYETDTHVVAKALVAGVLPSNLDISLTRDTLTISGSREDEREVEDERYVQHELFWGAFSRSISLPEEVDVDGAEAVEKHGILVIRLPKVNKNKATKLKVKTR